MPPNLENLFRIGSRFKVQEKLGEGAYGIVCSALDIITGKMVAIKKIKPFHHRVATLRVLRELKLLRYLNQGGNCDNIIQFLGVLRPDSFESLREVFIVQELMETDLHNVVRIQKLTFEHCQYFTYQIVRGVHFLHSAGIIHRDLKPSNLFVNANCDLKIGDFGLSRVMPPNEDFRTPSPVNTDDIPNEEGKPLMTDYVATRWYRSPELLLPGHPYGRPLDMWAIGCILGEMVKQHSLFPGSDTQSQLALIFDALGTPEHDKMAWVQTEKAKDILMTWPKIPSKPVQSMFRNPETMKAECKKYVYDINDMFGSVEFFEQVSYL